MAFITRSTIIISAFMFAWVSCAAMPGAAEPQGMAAPAALAKAVENGKPAVASAGPECTKPGDGHDSSCPHAGDKLITSQPTPPVQGAMVVPPATKFVPGLEEPLVATGYVSDTENKDLDAAAAEFRTLPGKSDKVSDFADYAKPLLAFMEKYPKSNWNAAILTDLGLGYFHAGYFSKAFDSWQQAWNVGKDATSVQARALIDKAVGELAEMHARVGHAKELQALFTDIGSRPVSGPATELLQSAKEGLSQFGLHPETSYLCGPQALENLLREQKADDKQIAVAEGALSGPHGVSLSQLDALATKASLKHVLIRRAPGQPIPVPSVINWNVHHYAAILSEHDGFYEVKDPTFGSPSSAMLTAKAIDSESSGYFLVPTEVAAAQPDAGWKRVKGSSTEAKAVFGMGSPNVIDGDATSGNDQGGTCGGGCSGGGGPNPGNSSNMSGSPAGPTPGTMGQPSNSTVSPPDSPSVMVSASSGHVSMAVGMVAASTTPAVVNLRLTDTPVGYKPQLGPSARATINYNSREALQPATFSFSNMSPKWTFPWMSYIVDDPAHVGQSVQHIAGGGGGFTFPAGYNATTGMFNQPESPDNSFLWRVPASGTLTQYTHVLPDGSKEIYSLTDGSAVYPRKVFLTSIVDATGQTMTINYDASFRVTSVVDAMGRSTTFSYSLGSYPLLVTQITDPFSRSASFTYDSTGRLSSITDVAGITSSFTYLPGEPSFINTMTTPYGTSKFSDRVNTYDPQQALSRSLTLTDPLGYTEYYYYNVNTNTVPASDPSAVVPVATGLSTGENGHLYYRNTFYWGKHAYPLAVTTDACNNPLLQDYTKAISMRWFFEELVTLVSGRALSTLKNPLENRIWFNYANQQNVNAAGPYDRPTYRARVLDDGSTQVTEATYNSLGMPATKTDELNRITQYNYDTNNIDLLTVKQKTVNSPLTYTTVATYGSYNSMHEPQTYAGADGHTWLYSYNSQGQKHTVTDPNSKVTTYNYDTSNRLINIVDANTVTVLTLTYDSYDRVRTRTDSQGYVLTYDYDNLDRVTKITYPDTTTDLFDYTFQSGPLAGTQSLELRKYTDRLGRVTTYAYDADQRLTSVTEPLTSSTTRTTSYAYYEDGTLKDIIDANGNDTHWTIDIQSRPVSKTYAYGTSSAKTETYTYENTTSRLKSITDALGQVKTFSYNKDNTIAGITYTSSVNPTPNVTFAYDTYFPRLSSMTDGTGTTNYSYTAIGSNGALALSSIAGPYTNDTLGLTYDNIGRLSGETISGGNESFSYDAISRPTGHTTPLGSFTNTFLGETSQITGRSVTNGTVTVSTAWGYDTNTNDRRLTSITNSGVTRSFTLGYGSSPVNPYDIMSITDTAATGHPWATQSHAYTYDYSDRLLTASYTTPGNFSYAYDSLDNPTTWTTPGGTTNPTYNGLNQISTWGSKTYSYDSNGNTLSGDGVKTYKWDAENRLIEIDYASGPTTKSQFTYDGFGHRRIDVETASGGGTTTTRYLWCGSFVCQIRDGSDTVLRRELAEGEYNVSTSQKLVYMPDNLNAVRDVLDATTGSLVQSYDYEPYGNVTRASGSTPTNYQYADFMMHSDSGLNLSSTRFLDTSTGRWLNRDTIREKGGLNMYAYVGADPINNVDPLGTEIAAPGIGIAMWEPPPGPGPQLSPCEKGCLVNGLIWGGAGGSFGASSIPDTSKVPAMGSVPETSAASQFARGLVSAGELPANLPFQVPTLVGTAVRWTSRTGAVLGRMVIPGIGWGMLAWSIYDTVDCMNACSSSPQGCSNGK